MAATHYKLTVSYDGTDYHGWQTQQDLPSIAQTLQHAFFNAFKQRIILAGASRTDAGVHAQGQVVGCTINFEITPEKLKLAWNNALPSEVVIHHIETAVNFSPYHNVVQKTYWYHFFTQRPSILTQRFGWYIHAPVDMQKLHECLQIFVGTHDFRSFCTGPNEQFKTGTVRTIDQITIEYSEHLQAHRIVVKGQKFLHHMIRRIVGAAIEVATNNTLTVETIKSALAARNPTQILPNAPAKGLLLHSIEYE